MRRRRTWPALAFRVTRSGCERRPFAAFSGYARERLAKLDVRMMADVFGVTTSYHNDVGIGQLWERFIDRVDAALPMVYPSHYWPGAYGFENPNAHPYEVVLQALDDATARSAAVPDAGAVVPWLQDFSLGDPDYGAPEVRAEIQATYDAGIQDWVLWNPGSHYTEAALEPTGGFRSEPRILVAGRVVPVSQRRTVLAQVEAARDSARAAAEARKAAADSARTARDSTVADTSRVRRRR